MIHIEPHLRYQLPVGPPQGEFQGMVRKVVDRPIGLWESGVGVIQGDHITQTYYETGMMRIETAVLHASNMAMMEDMMTRVHIAEQEPPRPHTPENKDLRVK